MGFLPLKHSDWMIRNSAQDIIGFIVIVAVGVTALVGLICRVLRIKLRWKTVLALRI
jgi:hypothetical protein